MNNLNLIDEGIKYLKKGEFLDAIDVFEEYLIHDKNNYIVYYYLSLAYIFRENYDEAYNYIRRAYDLNNEDTDVLNTIAFLQLKFSNVNEAINYWLDILDIEPSNFLVKRNLDKVRKSANVEKLSEKANPEGFINLKLVRKKKFDINIKKTAVFILGAVVILLIFLTVQKFFLVKNKDIRVSQLNNVSLDKIKDDYLVNKETKKSLFTFNTKIIRNIFLQTKEKIKKKKYNEAIILINKILHSNADMVVKEKFKILSKFIPVNREKIEKNIKFSDLMNFPTLYQGVVVSWIGKIEDLNIGKESTKFNFIVKENNISIGVARIIFNKRLVNLHNEIIAKIIGKFVKIDNSLRLPIIYCSKIEIKK